MKHTHILLGTCWLLSSYFISCNISRSNSTHTPSDSVAKLASSSTFTGLTCTNRIIDETELSYGSLSDPTNVYRYLKSELETGISNFQTNFKYVNSQGVLEPIARSADSVSIANIDSMYKIIYINSQYAPADGDYAALRMHLGMEGNKMVVIFEPIILKATNTANLCNIIPTGIYFRNYPEGTWRKINDSNEFKTRIDAYQSPNSQINIIHSNNASTKFMNQGDFATDDIQNCIIPIQQINSMYCDNAGASPLNTDKIAFTIIANNYFVGSPNYKLHIVASYNIGILPVADKYVGLGADFTQLCPINCNTSYVNYYNSDKVKKPLNENFKRVITKLL
jgi:hypothetical protein